MDRSMYPLPTNRRKKTTNLLIMQYDDWKLNNPDNDLNHDFGTCEFCNKDLKNDYNDGFCSASCKKHFNKELERTCEICGCDYTPTDNTETFNVCEENENCWLIYDNKDS